MADEISDHVQRFLASIRPAEWDDQRLAKARIIGDVASRLPGLTKGSWRSSPRTAASAIYAVRWRNN